MQDRYAGDIGDFGKYGLLRALCGEDEHGPALRLGVLWYRFEGDEEHAPGDVRHIRYLDPADERLRGCAPVLFDGLRELVRVGRSVAAVRELGILPERTAFFEKPLTFEQNEPRTERGSRRRRWLDEGLRAVEDADLVFADPDNGLPIQSVGSLDDAGPKYAYYDDLIPSWERGQSLVVYQHATRQGTMGQQIASRTTELREHFVGAPDPIVLRCRRISARAYFILPAPKHADRLNARAQDVLGSEWGLRGHFTRAAG